MKKIIGNATYVDLEGGFWGIAAKDGNYMPMNMPEQLKQNGQELMCYISIDEDVMTMQNWGTPCMILSFSTPNT